MDGQERREELWCPVSRRKEPHLVIETEGEYICWCQTCYMVQVIPFSAEDDDGCPLDALRKRGDPDTEA